jgi:hypothetical protein
MSTPKTNEEVERAEEHPKFETKTFKERRKEIPIFMTIYFTHGKYLKKKKWMKKQSCFIKDWIFNQTLKNQF